MKIFHKYSVVCSGVACQQTLFWYYFHLVLKFCCFLGFKNLKEWTVQNTTCDFFSFFSYLNYWKLSFLPPEKAKHYPLSLHCAIVLGRFWFWLTSSFQEEHASPCSSSNIKLIWVCLSIFEKMTFLSHIWPSLIFLHTNNFDSVLCHSLSCQSSILVFTFHLKFYYLWVHWLLMLSSQKYFKSSTSIFFPCCTYWECIWQLYCCETNQFMTSKGLHVQIYILKYSQTLSSFALSTQTFFSPTNSVHPALLDQRHSLGVIAVKHNYRLGFKTSLLSVSHYGLLSDFSHSQILSFWKNIYDKVVN